MATAKDGGSTAIEEQDWMGFIVRIQKSGTMKWDEILNSPLIRLKSIHKEVITIDAGAFGVSGDNAEEQVDTSKMSPDEYFEHVKREMERGR